MSGKWQRALREVEQGVQRLRDWEANVLPNDEASAQIHAYGAVLDIIERTRRKLEERGSSDQFVSRRAIGHSRRP